MSNLHNLHAREALNNITGLDTNWAAIGSHPPNEKANGLALRILEAIFSTRTKKPIVAASGEGGVAIVYKENDKYVAIECLNRGSLWMLWFDSNGEPQSRRISTSKKAIGQAIEEVGLVLNNEDLLAAQLELDKANAWYSLII